MVKDRLAEFQAQTSRWQMTAQSSVDKIFDDLWPADFANGPSAEQVRLLYTADQWNDVTDFLERVKQSQNDLHLLECYLNDVKVKHAELLRSPGGEQIAAELEQTNEAYKALSRTVRNSIARIGDEIQQIKGKQKDEAFNDPEAIDLRVRKHQLNSLSRRLHDVMQNYNEEQVKFRDRCKKRIESFQEITGQKQDTTDPHFMDDLDDRIKQGRLFDTQKWLLLTEREKQIIYDDVKRRHEDLQKLEASIRELHDIFSDMAMLVESQGEMINRIESNVMNTVDYTERAKKNMRQAVVAQKSARKKKVCLAIFCCILTSNRG